MKKIFITILLIIGVAFSGCLENSSKTINVITTKVDLKSLSVSSSIHDEVTLENVEIKTVSVASDGYYIFGNIDDAIFIAKLSFQNQFIWIKKYSSSNQISLIDINEDSGFIIRGEELVPSYKDNALIMKIDYNGNMIWNKAFGTESTLTQAFKIINVDNGYLIFGMLDENLWVIKLDKDGTKVWEKEIEYTKDNMYYDALKIQDKFVVYSANTQMKKQTIKVTIDSKGNVSEEDMAEIPADVKKEHDKKASYSMVLNQNLYQFIEDEKYYIVQKTLDRKVEWEYMIQKEELASTRSGIKVLETKDRGCIILHVFSEGPKKLSSKIIKLDKKGTKLWEKYFENNSITKGQEIKDNQFVFIGNNNNVNAQINNEKNTVKFSMTTFNKRAVLVFLHQGEI